MIEPCPDLRPYFQHLQARPLGNSYGLPVLSDWADKADNDPVFDIYKRCGLLNRDEAAILYLSAKSLSGREWLDIGAHTGWSACHAAAAGYWVTALDPMYITPAFRDRAVENMYRAGLKDKVHTLAFTGRMYFGGDPCYAHPMKLDFMKFDGVMIDGDHSWQEPLYDAVWSLKSLNQTGVILLHDFIGGPVREAVRYLMCEGLKCRIYFASSALLALCWRGDFTPPDYQSPFHPAQVQVLQNEMKDFDFGRCV